MKKGGKLEGWKIEKLGDVSKINYGYTEKASFKEVGPKFLRITDIQDNNVDWETVPFCKIEKSESPKYLLKDGDIVFARTGATTGKSFLIKKPPLAVFASYLIRLQILDTSKLLPEYLILFFQTQTYWDNIAIGISGSAQGGFNASKLSELEIPIPPLPEQQRIVSVLDEAFASIAQAKSNAERNLVNARELFWSVLQSSMSNDGWDKKTLKEISITFGRGKSKNRPRNDPKLYGGKYPFIQTGDIRNSNHYITEYTQTYNEVGLAQSKLWKKGTICITIAANIAETGILGFDACFPDSVIGLVVNPKIADTDFIEYLLQYFKKKLQAKGKGSAQDNLNMEKFENEYFPIPPLAEQRAIVGRLEALSAETGRLEEIYEAKVEALEELRRVLLGKAFEGNL